MSKSLNFHDLTPGTVYIDAREKGGQYNRSKLFRNYILPLMRDKSYHKKDFEKYYNDLMNDTSIKSKKHVHFMNTVVIKPFEENIAITKKVCEYAHAHVPYVTVEAELGTLAGIEDEVKVEHGNESYTRPEDVEEFVRRTGCDSLAIAIGTSHGAYKFKPEQCTRDPETGVLLPPPLRFDILEEVSKRLPGFPIVLHGSSSVNQEFVKIINEHGGALKDAVGVPEAQLRQFARLAFCKINIDSYLRLAMTAGIREHFDNHPEHFDPRQYIGDGRAYVKQLVKHKICDVLGSNDKI